MLPFVIARKIPYKIRKLCGREMYIKKKCESNLLTYRLMMHSFFMYALSLVYKENYSCYDVLCSGN